jgi:hypothetical protein
MASVLPGLALDFSLAKDLPKSIYGLIGGFVVTLVNSSNYVVLYKLYRPRK